MCLVGYAENSFKRILVVSWNPGHLKLHPGAKAQPGAKVQPQRRANHSGVPLKTCNCVPPPNNFSDTVSSDVRFIVSVYQIAHPQIIFNHTKSPMNSEAAEAAKIIFVRHGETDWNALRRIQGQSESRLNDTGKLQAAALRARIESMEIESIYCSPSHRTTETKDILTQNLQLETQYDPDLREIFLGPWEGLMWSDLEKTDPAQVKQFREQPEHFVLEGAETFQQMQDRGMSVLAKIVKQSLAAQKTRVLVVSHGAFIKTLLAGVAGIPVSRLCEHSALPNCSVSVVQFDGEKPGVETIADQAFEETAWA